MTDEYMTFSNGLTTEQRDALHDIRIGLSSLKMRIEDELPRHRSISLAITKIEEAELWLMDRERKPAGGGA